MSTLDVRRQDGTATRGGGYIISVMATSSLRQAGRLEAAEVHHLSRGPASAQASGNGRPGAVRSDCRVELKAVTLGQGLNQIRAGDFLLDCPCFA